MQDDMFAARQAEYAVYLRTKAWGDRRQAALARAGHRCQVCNSPRDLDVHHRTYERIFNELLEDLTVLCRRCHDKFHDKSKPKKRRRQKRAAALKKLDPPPPEWRPTGSVY